MIPDLNEYDWIVLNSSAGKDSQAMLDFVVEQCDQVGVPRDRLLVFTPTLAEWSGPGPETLRRNRRAITA